MRRSTDEDNQPYSIEMQDTRNRAYCASQPGWRVVKVYSDNASGGSTDRDNLQKMMRDARAGLFDVLLVYRVDRFTRNLRDMVGLLDDLDQAGVVFRSATEPFDTATPMGRMLVQMLGMFAQFERDTIIERVIAGMERAAAKGKWKGGRRPFGYTVDKKTQTLVPHETEQILVRLIFELYTRDRLGSNGIAGVINDRGFRTATGKLWSPQQVLRVLSNRVYLGELTFREITTDNCHPAIVDPTVFAEAQRLMDQRGESMGHRAANASDYVASGKLRCPRCGKSMIGTRATGKTKTYRYYTCWTYQRYGTDACDMPRLNADHLDQALLDATVEFYRTGHSLITQAVDAAQRDHLADHHTRAAELTTVNAELATVATKIDRYLDAFEDGRLDGDDEDVKDRLARLRATRQQLRDRKTELEHLIDQQPTAPDTATLDNLAHHIAEIARTGHINDQKTLIESLVAHVTISGNNTFVPAFRIPQQATAAGHDTGAEHASAGPTPGVRVPTHLVGPKGVEPSLAGT
ncbi:recombinase family protein [Actinophytocola sp.]|uniref:recombinase family protein n=1 Tax=Actinophytocola sp. TaxID=1872138 RepID=UPI00345BC5DD